MRVEVNPGLLRWAAERSKIETADLEKRFPKFREWQAGDRLPTLRQLEDFARATHTPVGYLFLDEPPKEQLPVPDFRTIADRRMAAYQPRPARHPAALRATTGVVPGIRSLGRAPAPSVRGVRQP